MNFQQPHQSTPFELAPTPEVSLPLMRATLVPEAAMALQNALQTQYPNLLMLENEAVFAPPAQQNSTSIIKQPAISLQKIVAPELVEHQPQDNITMTVPMDQPTGEIDVVADRLTDPNQLTQQERLLMARQAIDEVRATSSKPVSDAHDFKLSA